MTQLIACLLAASTALGGGAQAAANIGTLAARDVICDADPSGGHAYEWKNVQVSCISDNDSTHTYTYEDQRVCSKCLLIRERKNQTAFIEPHIYETNRISAVYDSELKEYVMKQFDICTICSHEFVHNSIPNN